MIAALAHFYAVSGRPDRARVLLKELAFPTRREYVSPFYIAAVYAGLNEQAKAVSWLDKAINDRSNPCIFLRVDPEFDSLRKDPDFVTLVKRFG
jgi:hypothetical protein